MSGVNDSKIAANLEGGSYASPQMTEEQEGSNPRDPKDSALSPILASAVAGWGIHLPIHFTLPPVALTGAIKWFVDEKNKKDPFTSAGEHRDLADSYLHEKKLAEAVEEYKAAIEKSSDGEFKRVGLWTDETEIGLGHAYFQLGQFKAARETYADILKRSPRDLTALRLHAEATQRYLESFDPSAPSPLALEAAQEFQADLAMITALNVEEEKGDLEKIGQKLEQAHSLSLEEKQKLLEATVALGQHFLELGSQKFPRVNDTEWVRNRLNDLASQTFSLLAQFAETDTDASVKKLAPLYEGNDLMVQGKIDEATKVLESIRVEVPEADAILKNLEGDSLRAVNLATLDVWEVRNAEGEKIIEAANASVSGILTGTVDYWTRSDGKTIQHDNYDHVLLEKNLVAELRKKIKGGEAVTIQEALQKILELGPEEFKDRAKIYLNEPDNTIALLVKYCAKLPPDKDLGRQLLDNTFHYEANQNAVETPYALYSLLNALASDDETKAKTKEHMEALQGNSSVARSIAKFWETTSFSELAVDVVLMRGFAMIGNLARLSMLSELGEMGVTGYKAIAIAHATGLVAEGNLLFTWNTAKAAMNEDVKQVFSPKHLAKSYGATLCMLSLTKAFAGLGNTAATSTAKVMGMVAEGQLTFGGKMLSAIVGHASGLGGMIASTQVNQVLHLQEKSIGGWKESLTHDVLGYIQFAVVHAGTDKVTSAEFKAVEEQQHTEIAIREATLKAQSLADRLGYKASKGPDGKIVESSERQRIVAILTDASLNHLGFSGGKLVSLIQAKRYAEANVYLSKNSFPILVGKDGALYHQSWKLSPHEELAQVGQKAEPAFAPVKIVSINGVSKEKAKESTGKPASSFGARATEWGNEIFSGIRKSLADFALANPLTWMFVGAGGLGGGSGKPKSTVEKIPDRIRLEKSGTDPNLQEMTEVPKNRESASDPRGKHEKIDEARNEEIKKQTSSALDEVIDKARRRADSIKFSLSYHKYYLDYLWIVPLSIVLTPLVTVALVLYGGYESISKIVASIKKLSSVIKDKIDEKSWRTQVQNSIGSSTEAYRIPDQASSSDLKKYDEVRDLRKAIFDSRVENREKEGKLESYIKHLKELSGGHPELKRGILALQELIVDPKTWDSAERAAINLGNPFKAEKIANNWASTFRELAMRGLVDLFSKFRPASDLVLKGMKVLRSKEVLETAESNTEFRKDLLECYEILKAILPQNHPETLKTQQALLIDSEDNTESLTTPEFRAALKGLFEKKEEASDSEIKTKSPASTEAKPLRLANPKTRVADLSEENAVTLDELAQEEEAQKKPSKAIDIENSIDPKKGGSKGGPGGAGPLAALIGAGMVADILFDPHTAHAAVGDLVASTNSPSLVSLGLAAFAVGGVFSWGAEKVRTLFSKKMEANEGTPESPYRIDADLIFKTNKENEEELSPRTVEFNAVQENVKSELRDFQLSSLYRFTDFKGFEIDINTGEILKVHKWPDGSFRSIVAKIGVSEGKVHIHPPDMKDIRSLLERADLTPANRGILVGILLLEGQELNKSTKFKVGIEEPKIINYLAPTAIEEVEKQDDKNAEASVAKKPRSSSGPSGAGPLAALIGAGIGLDILLDPHVAHAATQVGEHVAEKGFLGLVLGLGLLGMAGIKGFKKKPTYRDAYRDAPQDKLEDFRETLRAKDASFEGKQAAIEAYRTLITEHQASFKEDPAFSSYREVKALCKFLNDPKISLIQYLSKDLSLRGVSRYLRDVTLLRSQALDSLLFLVRYSSLSGAQTLEISKLLVRFVKKNRGALEVLPNYKYKTRQLLWEISYRLAIHRQKSFKGIFGDLIANYRVKNNFSTINALKKGTKDKPDVGSPMNMAAGMIFFGVIDTVVSPHLPQAIHPLSLWFAIPNLIVSLLLGTLVTRRLDQQRHLGFPFLMEKLLRGTPDLPPKELPEPGIDMKWLAEEYLQLPPEPRSKALSDLQLKAIISETEISKEDEKKENRPLRIEGTNTSSPQIRVEKVAEESPEFLEDEEEKKSSKVWKKVKTPGGD